MQTHIILIYNAFDIQSSRKSQYRTKHISQPEMAEDFFTRLHSGIESSHPFNDRSERGFLFRPFRVRSNGRGFRSSVLGQIQRAIISQCI